MSRRNRIVYSGNRVTKHFADPTAATAERHWYATVPWACPTLLSYTDTSITVERCAPATSRDIDSIVELLQRLDREGVHHRDVHPGNLVVSTDGPKLIDWETAIYHPAPSYDLYGPASGVPVPDIHAALASGYRMWLMSPHPMSIARLWRLDAQPALPSRVGRQRPPEPT